MKSVMISINPKWCALIARREKTVEVRKSRPKIDVPFRCYIYCTHENRANKHLHTSNKKNILHFWNNPNDCDITVQPDDYTYKAFSCEGKVIGEFVCDAIIELPKQINQPFWLAVATQMKDKDYISYLGNKDGYGWDISDLVIYDKPKELSEFFVPTKFGCCNEGKCRGCVYFDRGNGFNVEDDCNAPFCTDDYKPLTRPPQSWCYAEEVT